MMNFPACCSLTIQAWLLFCHLLWRSSIVIGAEKNELNSEHWVSHSRSGLPPLGNTLVKASTSDRSLSLRGRDEGVGSVPLTRSLVNTRRSRFEYLVGAVVLLAAAFLIVQCARGLKDRLNESLGSQRFLAHGADRGLQGACGGSDEASGVEERVEGEGKTEEEVRDALKDAFDELVSTAMVCADVFPSLQRGLEYTLSNKLARLVLRELTVLSILLGRKFDASMMGKTELFIYILKSPRFLFDSSPIRTRDRSRLRIALELLDEFISSQTQAPLTIPAIHREKLHDMARMMKFGLEEIKGSLKILGRWNPNYEESCQELYHRARNVMTIVSTTRHHQILRDEQILASLKAALREADIFSIFDRRYLNPWKKRFSNLTFDDLSEELILAIYAAKPPQLEQTGADPQPSAQPQQPSDDD